MRHYQDLFDGFKVERGLYFNGGFQIVNKSHKDFFDEVLNFYFENSDILREKQRIFGLSTDQTPINYLVQTKGMEINLLPQTYNLHHMVSKNLLNFGNSWWGDGMENLYEHFGLSFQQIPTNPLDRNQSYFIKREMYTKSYMKILFLSELGHTGQVPRDYLHMRTEFTDNNAKKTTIFPIPQISNYNGEKDYDHVVLLISKTPQLREYLLQINIVEIEV